MNKDYFIMLINRYLDNEKVIDGIGDYIPTFFEWPVVNFGWFCFNELIATFFTKIGIEIIDTFLLEHFEDVIVIDDESYPFKTPEDLWEIVKDYIK